MLDNWQDLSTAFSAAILNPDLPVPYGLSGTSRSKTEKRYAVYRNNVVVSLIGAMEDNFPAVRRLVGVEFFAAMAKVFIRAHPPKSRLLAEYGAEFSSFLETFKPLEKYPYMSDIARLERLWLDVYHEADAKPLDGTELASIDPTKLFNTTFITHPATRLFQSSYAAVSITAANRLDAEIPVIDAKKSECGLITRPYLQVDLRHISPSTHAFLTCLDQGLPLGQAAETALSSDAQFDLATNIQGMLEAGAFTSINYLETNS
jgi:Putative DNA-binding domain